MTKKIFETPEQRLFDLKVHAKVATEIEEGFLEKGVYAKALTQCSGDEERAKGLYIELRVQMIKDQIEVGRKKTKQTTGSDRLRDEELKKALKKAEEHQKRVLGRR
jgi:hypothetical protein